MESQGVQEGFHGVHQHQDGEGGSPPGALEEPEEHSHQPLLAVALGIIRDGEHLLHQLHQEHAGEF